jgi:aspartyl-tRNA(Asn)/glutamyl-tRNA(Gln) amidotransferase subunit C
MAMEIEQVRWVAHLARLELSDSEFTLISEQLGAIINYVNQLQEVDTTGVEPLAHPLLTHNVFRDDEPGHSLTPDQALANAPKRNGDFFSVPAVLD